MPIDPVWQLFMALVAMQQPTLPQRLHRKRVHLPANIEPFIAQVGRASAEQAETNFEPILLCIATPVSHIQAVRHKKYTVSLQ